MVKQENESDKIQCLECGKFYDFLAPHVNKAHQINLEQYRERWKIPKQQALASSSVRQTCRDNINKRIMSGDIVPEEQITMMKEARQKSENKKHASPLLKEKASETALKYQIWRNSPVIKIVSPELKNEAIRRMQTRISSKERVKDIVKDFGLSESRLYAWVKKN